MWYKPHPGTTYVMIYKLLAECVYNQSIEDGKYFLPWRRHILSISLYADRGIGTETCWVDSVFSPDDLWFGSDIERRVLLYISCF